MIQEDNVTEIGKNGKQKHRFWSMFLNYLIGVFEESERNKLRVPNNKPPICAKTRRLERRVASKEAIDLNGYKKGYEGYLIKDFPMVVEIHELRKVKEKDVGQGALILKELRNLNINGMTGYDALKFLYNWQKKLRVASDD